MIVGNIDIEWKEKKFLTLPVRLYLATMYYVRILMIREAVRKNTSGQSTWLRKFLREYNPESLPLPGYLVPHFQSIAAYAVPTDNRQTWVIPEIPNDIWTLLTDDEVTSHQWKLTQPNPAILLDMMRIFCARGLEEIDENVTAYNLTDGANHMLGGKNLRHATQEVDDIIYLCNPTIVYPFAESPITFEGRRRDWQNSKIGEIEGVSAAPAANADTIMDMLNLRESTAWFNECVSMTRILCDRYAHSTNFGQLDYEAGPETVIFGDVRIIKGNTFNGTARTELIKPLNVAYGNVNIATGMELKTKTWYPRIYTNPLANFTIVEKGVDEVCYLNAKHTLTNCCITFYFRMSTANANRITRIICLGSNGDEGFNAAAAARKGPFYNVGIEDGPLMTKWGQTYDHRTEVLTGREDLIRDGFYLM